MLFFCLCYLHGEDKIQMHIFQKQHNSLPPLKSKHIYLQNEFFFFGTSCSVISHQFQYTYMCLFYFLLKSSASYINKLKVPETTKQPFGIFAVKIRENFTSDFLFWFNDAGTASPDLLGGKQPCQITVILSPHQCLTLQSALCGFAKVEQVDVASATLVFIGCSKPALKFCTTSCCMICARCCTC